MQHICSRFTAGLMGMAILSTTVIGLPSLAPVYSQSTDCRGTLVVGDEDRQNIAIFQGPGLGYKVSGSASSGQPVRLLSTQIVKDNTGRNWANIQLLSGSRISGWVRYARVRHSCQVTFIRDSNGSSAEVGQTVPALRDLVGARAAQAEIAVRNRGYVWRNGTQQADSSFSNWTESRTGNCVAIRTTNGLYAAIVYAPRVNCDR